MKEEPLWEGRTPPQSLLPLSFQEKPRVPTGPHASCLQRPQGTCTPACAPVGPRQALPALSTSWERPGRAPLLASVPPSDRAKRSPGRGGPQVRGCALLSRW